MSSRSIYVFRECRLRPSTRELQRAGEAVALPSRVFDCLVYLLENRDRAVGRDELGAAVWGRTDVTDAQLSQAVLRARRAIGDDGSDQACIRTIPKFGYGWVAEVEVIEEEAVAPTATASASATSDTVADTSRSPHGESRARPGAGRGGAPLPGLRRAVAWLLPILALGLGLALLGPWREQTSGTAPAEVRDAVLILPLEEAGETGASWIRLGGIDIIGDRMRRSGMPVPPSDTTLALLRADSAGVDSTTLRERAGASWIVSGTVRRGEDGWRVELRAVGEGARSFVQSGDAENLIDALNSGTDGLITQLGHAPPAADAERESPASETLRRIKAALLENDLAGARRLADQSVALAADPLERQFQLANIDLREGHLESAEQAANGVLTELDPASNPALAGRTQILLGQIDLMMDRASDAAPRFEDALRWLDAELHPLDQARAMAGRGAALFTSGEHERGLEDIARARMLLQQSGDPLAQARIDQMAGSAELIRRRPAQARILLATAADHLEDFGAWNERMHALSELVQANLDLLDLRAAAAASDASVALMSKVPSPLHRAEALLYRAHLRIHQGRLLDARQLLEGYEALGLSGHARMQGIKHGLLALLARWDGNDREVISQAGESLHRLPENERELAARLVLARARAYWRLEGAGHDGGLDDLPELLRTDPEQLPVALARIERSRLQGEDPGPAFAALLERAERYGAPYDQLQVVEAWALDLLARGDVDAVAPLLGRLAPLAGQEFRFATLALRLSHAEKNLAAWQRALQRARNLAGERPIDPALAEAPGGT